MEACRKSNRRDPCCLLAIYMQASQSAYATFRRLPAAVPESCRRASSPWCSQPAVTLCDHAASQPARTRRAVVSSSSSARARFSSLWAARARYDSACVEGLGGLRMLITG